MTTVQHQKDVINMMRELLADNYTHLHVRRVVIEHHPGDVACAAGIGVPVQLTRLTLKELGALCKRRVGQQQQACMPVVVAGDTLFNELCACHR